MSGASVGRSFPPPSFFPISEKKAKTVHNIEAITWFLRWFYAFQMVFFLVMNILWFIVCLVQIIIAFIAWVIWHFIRKVVETNCSQRGSTCHCQTEKEEPWPGKSVEQRWIVSRAVKDYEKVFFCMHCCYFCLDCSNRSCDCLFFYSFCTWFKRTIAYTFDSRLTETSLLQTPRHCEQEPVPRRNE